MASKSLQERFEEKYIPEPNSGCWLWEACASDGGYGHIRHKGRMIKAHRASWMLYRGSIPDGQGYHGICVLHRCDVTFCVNPDHLFLGTNRDNVLDKYAKGRGVNLRGSAHGMAKLFESDVLLIRERLKGGESGAAIARDYGVKKHAIYSIKTGKNWSHV